jgi:pimeloyl-ACP methyl ester carboxylesterase
MKRGLLWAAAAPFVLVAILVVAALASASLREREARASSHPPGRFIDAFDTQVFVQQEGNSSAPAVVFIAGTAGWSGLWHASMAQTVASGFKAVAIDLPPFGFSYPPPSGDYSKRQQGRRLLAALNALNLGKVTIVAHSIGAAPVMEAVFSRPSQVTSLVLVDPALGLDAPQTDGSDTRLQAALRHAWLGRPLGAALTSPMLTASLLRRVISEKDRATSDWVQIYQRPFELRGASAALGQCCQKSSKIAAGRSAMIHERMPL